MISSMKEGGILLLEVVELKEELATEKQELDHLHQLCNKSKKTTSHLRKNIRQNSLESLSERVLKVQNVHLDLEELQSFYDDLQESIEIFSLETQMMEEQNSNLRNQIKKLEEEKIESTDNDFYSTHSLPPKSQNNPGKRWVKYNRRRRLSM